MALSVAPISRHWHW